MNSKTTQRLMAELEELEHELDYQVSHKRIAELQEQISEIETELNKRKDNTNDKER